MSVEVILKNVYTFLDILQKILNENIHKWDKNTISNVVGWAQYCTEMYSQAQDKSYKDKLDQQIRELGKLPWLLGSISINLDLMAQAEDLIKESLIQNCTLSREAFECVLNLYSLESNEGKQQCVKACSVLNSNRSILDIIRLLQASLINDRDEDTMRHLSVITQAELMFAGIQHLLEKARSNKIDRTRDFLRKKISEFALKPGAMAVLVAVLKFIHRTEKEMENNVKTIILHSILNLPTQKKQEFKSLMMEDSR